MIGLRLSPPLPPPLILISPSKTPKPFPQIPPIQNPKSNKFTLHAQNGNGNGGVSEENGQKKKGRLNLRWVDLVLDPDPDNIVAVGLTGLLTWASVQVLWQLVVVSAAILLAALKYTLVAALLVFILITLL